MPTKNTFILPLVAQFKRWENLLFWLLIAFYLFPIWYIEHFTTLDGPGHVGMASIISKLIIGHCAELKEYFQFTPAIVPNWFIYPPLAALLTVFSPETTQKIAISGYIILFPLAFRYVISATAPQHKILSLVAFALLWNHSFVGGGFNFIYGMVFYLFALGGWIRYAPISPWKITLTLLLLYLTHLFAFAAFCLSIASYYMWELIAVPKTSVKKRAIEFAKSGTYYLLLASPALILLAAYLPLPREPIAGALLYQDRLIGIFFPSFLLIYTPQEIFPSLLLSSILWGSFIALIIKRICQKYSPQKHDFLILLTLLLCITLLIIPASIAGGWMLETRLQLYIFLVLIFFISTEIDKLESYIFATALLLLSAIFFLIRWPELSLKNAIYEDYAQAYSQLVNNSTILMLDISPTIINYETGKERRRIPVGSDSGYATAQKCLIDMGQFHPAESNTFPISYREGRHPYHTLLTARTENSTSFIPPDINFRRFEKLTGEQIDYVLVRGSEKFLFNYAPEDKLDSKLLYANLMRQLGEMYTLTYTSPKGLARIYKHK